MELFWNSDLVENITKAGNNMTVQVNDDTLAVNHKETLPGYKHDVWFRKYSITNIIFLKNWIQQYWVTYDSIDHIFVVHREDKEKPNMESKMHESGLHFYNTTYKTVLLINTISGKQARIFQKTSEQYSTSKNFIRQTWVSIS